LSSNGPNVSGANRFDQLDDGSISGEVYHNAELGFRYQFPHGWIVNDKPVQEKAVKAGHQFVWGDDTSTKREKNIARQCSKGLLFVTQYPNDMRLSRFNPLAFLIAADPTCAPGVVFPRTVKDNEAIRRIAGQWGTYFKLSGIVSRTPARIRAFDLAGRVMVQISQSFITSTHEPGSTTVQKISSSILVMRAHDYWVMWMFASADDAQLGRVESNQDFLQ
jgi:hypothetical protein